VGISVQIGSTGFARLRAADLSWGMVTFDARLLGLRDDDYYWVPALGYLLLSGCCGLLDTGPGKTRPMLVSRLLGATSRFLWRDLLWLRLRWNGLRRWILESRSLLLQRSVNNVTNVTNVYNKTSSTMSR